ncbi:7299_t:CDS:1 [Gigaspora margarita]|uniref:7299_t:CDS:1 n=1 Tax=Gigaspora margarita TaxID=4874 RepID=A0ABN7VGH8_GIGMA|nr:7299_t:CDS:1 [Gigaspora margarita]
MPILTIIHGTLTSPLQQRGGREPYYYSFIRLKGQNTDLPVIFKLKNQPGNSVELSLKKGLSLELSGHYSNSNKNIRKSFTAYSYQILDKKRIRKKCIGCCDNFTCYQFQNYDYCKDCELNGSRYVQNKCPECGDGSGIVKFPHQPPRNCKTCYLARQELREENTCPK